MAYVTATQEAIPAGVADRGPAYQAYQLLHLGFIAAPILAGLDKYLEILTDWDKYLAPVFANLLGAETFMLVVGIIEIVAGIGVAVKPRIFAYVVAAWLAGIILNLLLLGDYYDVALRDLGLMLGALALGRLSQVYGRK
jgi:uncharacterized membrane protein YphA (DoxX/SURF4 family)